MGGPSPLISRPVSPSPLWFPALQDEYFTAWRPSPLMLSAHSSPDSLGVLPAAPSSFSSSRTAAAAQSTGAGPSISSSLSSPEPLVEIVGMPLVGRHCGCDDGDVDPALGGLLQRSKSHDTVTTATTSATLSTANTTAACATALDARIETSPSCKEQPQQQQQHRNHRRKSSRASHKALSAQDWASIMTQVNSSDKADKDEGDGHGGDPERR
jgi:hypothetical protein